MRTAISFPGEGKVSDGLRRTDRVIKRRGDSGMHRKNTALLMLPHLQNSALSALQQNCISMKHYKNISVFIADCESLLGAWIKSDRRRYAPSQDVDKAVSGNVVSRDGFSSYLFLFF